MDGLRCTVGGAQDLACTQTVLKPIPSPLETVKPLESLSRKNPISQMTANKC